MTARQSDAARRTPWEVVFAPATFEEEHFPAIAAEIEARGVPAKDPGAFVMLGSVGSLLRALRPDEDSEHQASPDAVLRYGALAFQAFHFRQAGKQVYTVSEATVDALIEHPGLGEWRFRAPGQAGYVQLPRHRIWVPAEGGGAPEPVDGFFWTGAADEDGSRFDLLLCTGMRPGRPGIGAIDVSIALPAGPPGHWGDLDARESGPDFANVLPGGELGRLYALTNAAEALKLVSRIFWCADTRPGAVGDPVVAPDDTAAATAHGQPSSALPARPIRMTANGDDAP